MEQQSGAPTGQETLTLKGHVGCVNSVSFSPDGQRYAGAIEEVIVGLRADW